MVYLVGTPSPGGRLFDFPVLTYLLCVFGCYWFVGLVNLPRYFELECLRLGCRPTQLVTRHARARGQLRQLRQFPRLYAARFGARVSLTWPVVHRPAG